MPLSLQISFFSIESSMPLFSRIGSLSLFLILKGKKKHYVVAILEFLAGFWGFFQFILKFFLQVFASFLRVFVNYFVLLESFLRIFWGFFFAIFKAFYDGMH
jgi:hypothetical protein